MTSNAASHPLCLKITGIGMSVKEEGMLMARCPVKTEHTYCGSHWGSVCHMFENIGQSDGIYVCVTCVCDKARGGLHTLGPIFISS